MTEYGMCKLHGQFILTEGCPECLAKNSELMQSVTKELNNRTGTTTPETITAKPPPTALVRVDPEQDERVKAFYDQAVELREYAEQRVIISVDDLKTATNDMSIIVKVKKGLEEKRKEYLQPFKEHIEEINESFKGLLEPILAADSITRKKMLDFDAEQKRVRAEQERINRKRLEAAEAEMKLNGELSESVNLVEVVPEAPKRTQTEMGTTGQRMIKKYRVINFAELADQYKIENSALLNKVVKAGIPEIPGVEIYEEPIITVNVR